MTIEKISAVVSVYNEEAALPLFYEACRKVLEDLEPEYEILFVNDGSRDRSPEILRELAAADPRVKMLSFSRNFGHEAAMIAGVDYASGDLVICMDADLQHPVTCIPQILECAREGYDVINMVRRSNHDAGPVKNVTSAAFYRLINLLSDTHMENGASDFFALSRRAADVIRRDYRERNRFIRGFIQNIGFRKTVLEYDAADRVAGRSKYSIRKLFRFSLNIIVGFSELPLKLGLYVGVFTGILSLIQLIRFLAGWAAAGAPDPFRGLLLALLLLFTVLFLLLGIQGEYLASLSAEVRGRPIYIVEETRNL